jgi:hypothetical protein
MGFSLPFGKKRKMRKLMENYFRNRNREKIAFDEQKRRLNSLLNEKQIEQQTYKRFRAILETQYHQKKREDWTKVHNKFQNSLNS